MKKTTQVKKNAEAAVRRNPIARFFGRKSFKRRVGRPEITKSQRVSVKNQGNSTSKATLKSKSLKAKTKGKSNTIPRNGTKNNEEDKKKRMKWSVEYLHKVQKGWDEKSSLAIDSNRDPITNFE